jgi:hypothetical protein
MVLLPGARFVYLVDYATGWTIQGSNPDTGKRYISLLHNVDTSLLYNGYRGPFPGYSGRDVKLTLPLDLVPMIRMPGAIPLLSP